MRKKKEKSRHRANTKKSYESRCGRRECVGDVLDFFVFFFHHLTALCEGTYSKKNEHQNCFIECHFSFLRAIVTIFPLTLAYELQIFEIMIKALKSLVLTFAKSKHHKCWIIKVFWVFLHLTTFITICGYVLEKYFKNIL